jgi:hypothetical protein
MSITNYFGKPRAKYVPYKSPYTFEHYHKYTIPSEHIHVNQLDNFMELYAFMAHPRMYIPDNRSRGIIYYDMLEYHKNASGSGTETYQLQNINYMFNEVVNICMKYIELSFWSLNKLIPNVNIYQIIIMKLSDVDKHVDHLEKIVASLCEDNTLLSNRIKALEQRLSRPSEIPIAEPVEHTVAEAVLKDYSLPK